MEEISASSSAASTEEKNVMRFGDLVPRIASMSIDEEEPLAKWRLPPISASDIYKVHSVFKFSATTHVFFHEDVISVGDGHLDHHFLPLITPAILAKIKKTHHNIHLGCLQVGIVPLFRRGLNVSCVSMVLDTRHTNLADMTMGIISSSLSDGPVQASFYPGYPLSLQDPHINDCIVLHLQTQGLAMKQGAMHVNVHYRFVFRSFNTHMPVTLNKQLKGSTMDFIQLCDWAPLMIAWGESHNEISFYGSEGD